MSDAKGVSGRAEVEWGAAPYDRVEREGDIGGEKRCETEVGFLRGAQHLRSSPTGFSQQLHPLEQEKPGKSHLY